VVTLSTLGYDASQLKTVPFLLLIWALDKKRKEPKSEFNERVYQSLLDTCYHIIIDDESFKSHLKNVWNNYLTKGTLRTVDSVNNSNVFLAQIYCMIEKGLLEKPKSEHTFEVLKRVVEEDMRRKQNKQATWNSSSARNNICKLLNFVPRDEALKLEGSLSKADVKTTIEEEKQIEVKSDLSEFPPLTAETIKSTPKRSHKTAVNKNQIQHQEAMKKKVETPPIAEAAKPLLVLKPEDIVKDDKFENMTEAQNKAKTEFFSDFKRATRDLTRWFRIFLPDTFKEEGEFIKVEDIGITSPIQLLTVYIQNKLQAKNADRNDAFEKSTFVDVFKDMG